jgi:phosphatidylglycerophosphate synthase
MADRTREGPRTRRGVAVERPFLASLANRVTLLRLGAIPVLWVIALAGHGRVLGVGLALAAGTDLLDGWLARRRGEASRMGSRVDSVADHLLTASTAVWIWLLHPEVYRRHGLLLAGWAVVVLAAMAVALVRFRRPIDLHLQSARTGVFAAYAFCVFLFVAGGHPAWLFYGVWALMMVGAVETLLVLLVRADVDEHQPSLFFPRSRAPRS